MPVFWVVAPCSLLEVQRRFRGACCLHYQGDRPDDGGSKQANIDSAGLDFVLQTYEIMQCTADDICWNVCVCWLVGDNFLRSLFALIKSSRSYSSVSWLQEETDVLGTICPHNQGCDVMIGTEIVPETSVYSCNRLTQLCARKDFIEFSRRESFKLYTICTTLNRITFFN
jgi:hypothetical protein